MNDEQATETEEEKRKGRKRDRKSVGKEATRDIK